MLCGEFHRATVGLCLNSVFQADIRSPYYSLLTLIRGMAAVTVQTAHDDEDIFLGKETPCKTFLASYNMKTFIYLALFLTLKLCLCILLFIVCPGKTNNYNYYKIMYQNQNHV